MSSIKKGFTLVELLVVMGVLAVLMGALASSISGARERARVQKATADVKVISQAILAYENYDRGSGKFELPTLNDQDATPSTLAFLIGEGGNAASGGQIPVLLQASIQGGRAIMDPWGTPYKVKIKETSVSPRFKSAMSNLQTGYYLPNFYRLSEKER